MPDGEKRCFVVMGFGIKTDFATGRKLDLDKSYRVLIKPAVEERGLRCVRADEIRHSGMIDVPMYQELLTADVVVADLSTANPNALYELGIRHALRPWTTIVISEEKLLYPFDLNHVLITRYAHLGEAIDYDEVIRFRKQLSETITAVLAKPKTDSPVYTFLGLLKPPILGGTEGSGTSSDGLGNSGKAGPGGGPDGTTLSALVEQGEQAIKTDRFVEASAAFRRALDFGKADRSSGPFAQDSYLVQRLVLATYKARQPDELSALRDALQLLAPLDPADSNDPETVGLAGAIEKRLFDKGDGVEHLGRAVRHYARGYFLRTDRYNGINLAYLLNVRTDSPLDPTDQDKIADLVWANRIRWEVLPLCEQELKEIGEREERLRANPDQARKDQLARDGEQKFWCLATKAEAHFGLAQFADYAATSSQARAIPHAGWMTDTFAGQIKRLGDLLTKHGELLHSSGPLTIEGIVQDQQGTPLQGVRVEAGSGEHKREESTNADGYYRLELDEATSTDQLRYWRSDLKAEQRTPASGRKWHWIVMVLQKEGTRPA